MNLHPYSKQAKMARKILTAIKKDPAKFNMGAWYDSEEQFLLRPNEEPVCGTSMCVAGWAVHFSGWTLSMAVRDGSAARVAAGVAGETYRISDLAHKILGLPEDNNQLFFTEDDIAVACLMRMASGEPFTSDMHYEEEQRARDSRGWSDVETAQRIRRLLGVDTPVPAVAE